MLAGTIVFGDRLAVANIWGVVVTLGGIGWYNWIKILKMKEEMAGEEKEGGYEMVRRIGEGEVEDEEAFEIDDEGEQEHSRSQ